MYNLSSILDGDHFNIGATKGELRLFTDANATFPRLHILPITTGVTINSYPSNTLTGYVGIGSNASEFPVTLLHLVDGSGGGAYRPWMQSGMSVTRDDDTGYFGFKGEDDNSNHTVIAWGDNLPSQTGPDLLKFIFSADNIVANGIAGTDDALEAVRVAPASSGDESFFGIGDWFTTGGNANPTERLDLLDGRLRIRQLPTDAVSTSTEFVTVNTSTGVLEHRPMATLPDNCEWQMENANYSGPSYQHDVYTAVGSSDACPDATDAVGIGISTPSAKLDVLREPQSGDETGLRVITRSDGNYSGPFAIAYGIIAASQNATGQSPSPQHIGVFGTAQYGSLANHGIYGRAVSSSTYPASNGNHGCRGEAGGQDKCYGLYGYAYGTGPTNYGVYGTAGTGATVNRAGYFAGNLEYTGSLIPPSDQLLKQNIEDLGDALPTLLQLQPKTFQFRTEEYPHMHLATGTQMGLIAQDVAQVLPNLVHDCMHPEEYDTTGTLVHAAVPHLGVDYISLIPLLVASVKEQQAMIQQQQDLITDMQHQLSACCSAGGDGRALPANQGAAGTSTALETDLRVIPNPVAAHTELRYTVGTEGTVRLTITAPDGRTIRTQDEGLRAVGTYSYGWDTTALAPGTYHCTLFVNDELVVRKAVKVAGR